MKVSKEEIIETLKTEYKDIYLPTKELPKPYYEKIQEVKVIVLGCDPSNKEGKLFNTVFGLDESLKYFESVNKNLGEIKLCKSDIYAQNLCQNYFKKETYENKKYWLEIANRLWIPYLKDELDALFSRDIPVFATSEIILRSLCYPEYYVGNDNEYYYKNVKYIKEHENKLGRRIFPFFRHYKYSLKNWREYADFIKSVIQLL